MRVILTIFGLASLLAAQGGVLRGHVTTGGVPVPGAAVMATLAPAKPQSAATDADGGFAFTELASGTWTVRVSMTGFVAASQQVAVPPGAEALDLDLAIAPYQGPPPGPSGSEKPAAATTPAAPGAPATFTGGSVGAGAATALAINGSMDNAAASPFALPPAFGNNRRGPSLLYNGGFGFTANSSALDARSFSLTGQDTPKPAYNDLTGFIQIGGPLLIPHLLNLRSAPMFFVSYQKTLNRNAVNTAGLMPTDAERGGDLSALGGPVIPTANISPQAKALLALFPEPNLAGGGGFNYQVPIVTNQHQDALQTRLNKSLAGRNQLASTFNLLSTRSDKPNLFGFLDGQSTLGINASLSDEHGFSQSLYGTFTVQFSRQTSRTTPFFANVKNISGLAGIVGNDQAPQYWGPPALTFSDGLASLGDGNPAHNRNQTAGFSASLFWNHYNHNLSFGGDVRRLEFNYNQQQNPRGGFLFNGSSSGEAFGDFLEGAPASASLGYGTADKYFRQTTLDGFVDDDWRSSDAITLDLGLRWEYQAPISELYGRVVNLDTAPGFATAAPVLGEAAGLRPDRGGVEPRLGLSWRPWAVSSVVIRAGYGVYYNTSVYPSIALQMAQQAPLSLSLSVANSAATPLTLANGFTASGTAGGDVFAVDPDFRIGYAQTWNASLQRDLPAALVMTLSYLGTKGTRGVQEFLPNTYPPGGTNPCPSCPAGFVYMASNGNSTLESGSARLQRRFHNGLAADLQYTYGHAMDDAALGGRGQGTAVVAQNWMDLDGERARSDFDQRHKLILTAQYSTGVGLLGGALLRGWKGALYKGWTITTQITAGSGLPLTPMTLEVVPGSGMTGIRPDATGAAVQAISAGRFLNPAAYTAPLPGTWGTAGRNSINGPSQFDLDAAMQRTFQVTGQVSADLRIEATNALNHVAFPRWNTIVGSAQFGLPTSADAMRSVQTTLRFNF